MSWMFDAHIRGFQGGQTLKRSVRRRTYNAPETFQQRFTTLRRSVPFCDPSSRCDYEGLQG
jgi:hypothetical protein